MSGCESWECEATSGNHVFGSPIRIVFKRGDSGDETQWDSFGQAQMVADLFRARVEQELEDRVNSHSFQSFTQFHWSNAGGSGRLAGHGFPRRSHTQGLGNWPTFAKAEGCHDQSPSEAILKVQVGQEQFFWAKRFSLFRFEPLFTSWFHFAKVPVAFRVSDRRPGWVRAPLCDEAKSQRPMELPLCALQDTTMHVGQHGPFWNRFQVSIGNGGFLSKIVVVIIIWYLGISVISLCFGWISRWFIHMKEPQPIWHRSLEPASKCDKFFWSKDMKCSTDSPESPSPTCLALNVSFGLPSFHCFCW